MKLNSKRALTFIYLLSLMIFGETVFAQTAQQIAKRAFGSTVLLVAEDANGQPLSLGSGFFVRDSEIATNFHVVEGATRGYAKLVGQKTKFDIEGVTAVDQQRDLIVLKITGHRSQTLSLGNSDAIQVGETIYAVGNPQGLEGTFSQGIVSSIREFGDDKLVQITAPISPGSSGGPVLNSKGEVIGVSVATFRGGQNLNFAIPSNYLKLLLAKTGSAKPLALETSRGKQRSIVAHHGEPSTEGVVGNRFVWTNPVCINCGDYTFSLQNKLPEDIRNISGLIVFYDALGNAIDFNALKYSGLISAGLAKRMTGKVDPSVQKLTKPDSSGMPHTRVVIRILNFEIVN